MKLTELRKNQIAIVKRLNTDKLLKNRLLSFGLIRGSKIVVSEYSVAKKTIQVIVNGTTIAIRNEEAKLIDVEAAWAK